MKEITIKIPDIRDVHIQTKKTVVTVLLVISDELRKLASKLEVTDGSENKGQPDQGSGTNKDQPLR